MLQASAMETSRTNLDESVMPPPSGHRGQKRKAPDTESILPVSPNTFSGGRTHNPTVSRCLLLSVVQEPIVCSI